MRGTHDAETVEEEEGRAVEDTEKRSGDAGRRAKAPEYPPHAAAATDGDFSRANRRHPCTWAPCPCRCDKLAGQDPRERQLQQRAEGEAGEAGGHGGVSLRREQRAVGGGGADREVGGRDREQRGAEREVREEPAAGDRDAEGLGAVRVCCDYGTCGDGQGVKGGHHGGRVREAVGLHAAQHSVVVGRGHSCVGSTPVLRPLGHQVPVNFCRTL